jgi:hypothetical protein
VLRELGEQGNVSREKRLLRMHVSKQYFSCDIDNSERVFEAAGCLINLPSLSVMSSCVWEGVVSLVVQVSFASPTILKSTNTKKKSSISRWTASFDFRLCN